MNENQACVAPLQKVTLALSAQGVRRPFTFIVGVGTGGLSPFEYALLEKKPGDVVRMQIAGGESALTFEHLDPPVEGLWVDGRLDLEAEVSAVEPAAPREIVQAMAASGGCGGGCGCGCG